MPATDPNKAYTIGKLRPLTSRFIVQTYGTEKAPDQGSLSQIDATVTTWLNRGVPREAFLLGLPLYGPAPDGQKTVTYAEFRELYQMSDNWDSTFAAYWSSDPESPIHLPDVRSLGVRFERVFERNLAGVALWALSYDHGFPEVQQLVRDKFARSESYKLQLNANDSLPSGWITEDGGQTRLRNEYNWVWMMVGCVFLVILLLIMKRYFK